MVKDAKMKGTVGEAGDVVSALVPYSSCLLAKHDSWPMT